MSVIAACKVAQSCVSGSVVGHEVLRVASIGVENQEFPVSLVDASHNAVEFLWMFLAARCHAAPLGARDVRQWALLVMNIGTA